MLCVPYTYTTLGEFSYFHLQEANLSKKNLKMDEELQDDIARYYGWRASVELNELNLPLPQGSIFTLHTTLSIKNLKV
jgi:hypothetical protein